MPLSRLQWILPALALGASCLVSACSSPGAAVANKGDGAARTVVSVAVAERPLERVVTVNGTLAAEDEVALAFKVTGRVQEVTVDLGSPVRQGQVLARLLDTDFQLRLNQAESAMAQARVRLGLTPTGDDDTMELESTGLVRQRRAVVTQTRNTLERVKTFFERGISSKADLDSAQAAAEVAEGQYQDAIEEIRNRQGVLAQRRSELELARQQLQDTVLTSPIDGAVRERQVTVGEYRTAGTPVLTIVRTDPLRLRVAVPERAAPALSPGQPVRVRVEGNSAVHDGRLARIGAAIDEGNRTLPVEAVVSNRSGAIRPGQFATAEIVVSHGERSPMIPADAVISFAGVQRVFVADGGKARERRITTGRRDGDDIEVIDGLKTGDRVIRSPGDLADGVAIREK